MPIPQETAPDHLPPVVDVIPDHDLAHITRLMRLLITAIDHAGDDGLLLTREDALVGLARVLVKGEPHTLHTSRTSIMALRDLVWRVDTARALITQMVAQNQRAEIAILLATDDIHEFLSQEP